MIKKWLWLTILFAGCAGSRRAAVDRQVSLSEVKFIGVHDIPNDLLFNGTTVGGLSGIDYDASGDVYYLVSDDRSAINPARFYTAKIFLQASGIDSVVFVKVTNLLQPDGTVYPNSKQDPAHTPDPEALRYHSGTRQMVWTSEGEKITKANDTVLANPAITLITADGKYIDSFPLPANLRMHASAKGPRQNGVLEGMSFADHHRNLYVAVEEPLYEDGPRADLVQNDPWIRIFRFDMASRKNTAQYAYKLDPIAYAATPADGFKVNGIPDILYIGNNQLIVLERSFSTGRLSCTVKLFLADMNGAENIILNPSLAKTPPLQAVTKRLLLNMDELGIYVDNVEGITFGPTLPNGHKTLLLVADNNFSALEKTQFFLFEIIP